MSRCVARVDALDAEGIDGLAGLLVDATDSGASVGFLPPLPMADARAYWTGIAEDVAAGRRLLLVVRDADGRIDGTAHLALPAMPNQRHRADVSKLLVHRRARGRGLARQLMDAIEAEALAAGRWLLVLDTAVGHEAEAIYRHLGWIIAGVVPDYAANGDGTHVGTIFMWKRLSPTLSAPTAGTA